MALTYPRPYFSSTEREKVYDRCRGENEFPTCNICGHPVDGVRQAWDISHDPDLPPRVWGGTETGVAHRSCNRRHGAEVVVPMVSKADRVRQKNKGAFVTRHKLPGGRDSKIKKLIGGGVVARRPRHAKIIFEKEPTLVDELLAAVNPDFVRP